MRNRTPLVLTASLAALAALPATASANVAAVCADRTVTVKLDHFWSGPVHLDDLTVSVGGTVVRTGAHSFEGPADSLVVAAPGAGEVVATARHHGSVWTSPAAACAPVVIAPPVAAPAPGPAVAEPTPTTPAGPPSVKEGGRKKPSRPMVPRRTERVLRAVACRQVGDRGFAVVRISVVWKRGGEVVKTKTAVVRRPGPVCRTPAVTG